MDPLLTPTLFHRVTGETLRTFAFERAQFVGTQGASSARVWAQTFVHVRARLRTVTFKTILALANEVAWQITTFCILHTERGQRRILALVYICRRNDWLALFKVLIIA